MDKEPLFTVATITAVATAILGVLVAFGLNLSEVQTNSILGLVAVAAPFVVAWVARGRVTSPATMRAMTTPQRSPEPPA